MTQYFCDGLNKRWYAGKIAGVVRLAVDGKKMTDQEFEDYMGSETHKPLYKL